MPVNGWNTAIIQG